MIESLIPLCIRMYGGLFFLPLGEGAEAHVRRLILSICFLPLLYPFRYDTWTYSTLCHEFILGMAIGLPFFLMLTIGEWSGELFDTGRGMNIGSMIEPMSQVEQSYSGALMKWALLAILVSQNGLLLLIELLQKSFNEINHRSLHHLTQIEFSQKIFALCIESIGNGMYVVVSLFALFLFVESVCALASKLLRIQFTTETFFLKTFLSSLVLFICITNTNYSAKFFEFYKELASQIETLIEGM